MFDLFPHLDWCAFDAYYVYLYRRVFHFLGWSWPTETGGSTPSIQKRNPTAEGKALAEVFVAFISGLNVEFVPRSVYLLLLLKQTRGGFFFPGWILEGIRVRVRDAYQPNDGRDNEGNLFLSFGWIYIFFRRLTNMTEEGNNSLCEPKHKMRVEECWL